MARAEVYFEDDGEHVQVAWRYLGGTPDKQSAAHQLANACRRFLEDHLRPVGEPVETVQTAPVVEVAQRVPDDPERTIVVH